jgi:hypothetical protein
LNPNYGISRLDLNSENEPFFITISGNVVRTETPGTNAMNGMGNINILKQGSGLKLARERNIHLN